LNKYYAGFGYTPLLSLYKSLSTVEKSGNFGKHGFSFAYFAFSDRTKQHIFSTKNTATVCAQAKFSVGLKKGYFFQGIPRGTEGWDNLYDNLMSTSDVIKVKQINVHTK
jgi:hypothetical protein